MPTYQYSCTECGHFFEQFQSFSEDSLTTCPECSGRLRKVFNAVGVVFKGSGFYRNDSRSTTTSTDPAGKSSSESAGGGSTTKSGSEGGSGGTSDAGKSSSTGSGQGSSSLGRLGLERLVRLLEQPQELDVGKRRLSPAAGSGDPDPAQ